MRYTKTIYCIRNFIISSSQTSAIQPNPAATFVEKVNLPSSFIGESAAHYWYSFWCLLPAKSSLSMFSVHIIVKQQWRMYNKSRLQGQFSTYDPFGNLFIAANLEDIVMFLGSSI